MEFENMNIEQNEEMTTELVELDDVEVKTEEEDSGLSTLAAMAVGAGLTAATFGVVKLVKKGIKKLKLKKEASEAAEASGKGNQVEAEYRDVTDEEVGEDE